MTPGIGRRARRRLAGFSLAGSNLPERIRTMAFAMLGLTTAAALGLVLLFSQTSLSIPSLGPVTQPLSGRQAVHGGIALGAAGTSRAASARFESASASSPSLPLAVPAAADDFAAAGTPRGDSGVGAAAGDGTWVAGNGQKVSAVQPQSTAVGTTTDPASTSEPGGAAEPAPAADPAPAPASVPPPAGPGTPTSSEPPTVEPELPPPGEDAPEGELPAEPPAAEPPVQEEGGGGFMQAVVRSRGAL